MGKARGGYERTSEETQRSTAPVLLTCRRLADGGPGRETMTSGRSVEQRGRAILLDWLTSHGREAKASDRKTFDLVVDGEYAEMKAKSKGWSKFDFISLTEAQNSSLGRELKRIFIVLNVDTPAAAEVIEIDAADLLACKANRILNYEYNKGAIAHLI